MSKDIKVGQQWKTKGGETVTIISKNGKAPFVWIAVDSSDYAYSFTNTGKYWVSMEESFSDLDQLLNVDSTVENISTKGLLDKDNRSTKDLFMPKTKKTLWLNVYPGNYSSVAHLSKEGADEHSSPNRIGGKAYSIEIEE